MQSAACQHPRFQAIYAPHQGQRSSGAVFTNAHLVTSHPSTYGQDVLLCASFMKKDFKSVEVNRIQDCGHILNFCSPGAAYAASPQWGGLLQLLFQIFQSKTIEQPFFSFLGRKVYRFVAIVVIRGGGEGEKIGFIAKPTTNQPNPTSEDASENLKLLLFFSSHVAVCLYTMSQ